MNAFAGIGHGFFEDLTRSGSRREEVSSPRERSSVVQQKKPYFSVCIPNYNYEKFIGETIQSVLDQSFQDFEILVADNASTDDSVRVIQSFRSPQLRLLENRYNIGFSPNLDRATHDARGQHLLLLSSDDLMRRDALKT